MKRLAYLFMVATLLIGTIAVQAWAIGTAFTIGALLGGRAWVLVAIIVAASACLPFATFGAFADLYARPFRRRKP